MPKMVAQRFNVRPDTDGVAELLFLDRNGRQFSVLCPAGGLMPLIERLNSAASETPIRRPMIRLDQSAQLLSGEEIENQKRQAADGTLHPDPTRLTGGFVFGASADLSKVFISVTVPGHTATVDVMISLSDARKILDDLSRVVTLVARETSKTEIPKVN